MLFLKKIPGLCGKGVTLLDKAAYYSAVVTADGYCLVWGRIDNGQLSINFTPWQL